MKHLLLMLLLPISCSHPAPTPPGPPSLLSGSYNVIWGDHAGWMITSGNYNLCVGSHTCAKITTENCTVDVTDPDIILKGDPGTNDNPFAWAGTVNTINLMQQKCGHDDKRDLVQLKLVELIMRLRQEQFDKWSRQQDDKMGKS